LARPTKPLVLVQGHRTKAEKAVREKAEKELLTGTTLKEWSEVKADPIAHKEFTRIKKLLKAINKDDDLFGAVINTQCKLLAEEQQMVRVKDYFVKTLEDLEEGRIENEMPWGEYMNLKTKIQGQIISCDKGIMQKRKLMLDISKENIQTIQSALRSIPKKEQPKNKSPMAEFLERRNAP
jgi:hypothetical protein